MASCKISGKKLKENQTQMIQGLPDEITELILLRLDVEILMKFKCVSKSWCSLISSKHFIKSHLQNSNKDVFLTHHRLLSVSSHNQSYKAKHYNLQPLVETNFLQHSWGTNPNDVSRLVGSVNGLCCMMLGTGHFIIWNLCNARIKRLPDWNDDECGLSLIFPVYGFGLNESNDDYMVYYSNRTCRIRNAKYFEHTRVYSLKTNSWKMVEHVKKGIPSKGRGTLLKGKLHWLNSDFENSACVVYFDSGSELHGTMELPSRVQYPQHASTLGVLDECLCLLSNDYRNNESNLWIYEQYGANESLVKLVTIPHTGNACCSLHTPICRLPSGEIVLFNKSRIIVFYPKLGYFKPIDKRNSFGIPKEGVRRLCFGACLYVKSLISPFSYGGEP